MKKLLIFIALIASGASFAQTTETGKAIILHPAIGKLIDPSEKITFALFPEYKDSTFNNAYIVKYNDSTFTVIVINIKNQSIEKSISRTELDKMYYQIDEISQKEKPVYNEEKKKRKRSGPNYSYNSYYLTETLVQLTLITIDALLIIAN